ncbi:hypothetical protein MB46_04485 [Arthrobacter alpinus]|uniref:hypothetical protein n=1 Tax=Arthrobacter alpinus TaxID=656366 RepID=UPI0005C9C90D|nr:hypothetical protein [Arthrobacter alpinus]ALV44874.1 hypothetical protein MB46_04485 [Arthrobacter alpinus]
MLRQAPTKPDPHILATIEADASDRIWCDECHTDQYVLLERARRRRRNGAGVWDVDYTCMHCDSFYGHEIEIDDLNAATAYAIITVMQQPGTSVRVNDG